MIALKNLNYYIDKKPILQGLNWRVNKGQHALILGESGCGKTTLLHLLAGLLQASSGSIAINGIELSGMNPKLLDHWRGQHIGMVFQTLHLVKALTVIDNIRLARYLAGLVADDTHIALLLAGLHLEDRADYYPRQLSVGQQQRVGIARALAVKPSWIFADEPTSALDDRHCEATVQLLKTQAEDYGATLVIATHDQRIKSHFSHQLTLRAQP